MSLQEGMLWCDDSAQRSLRAKLEQAMAHYRAKYGRAPNLCYLHPGDWQAGELLPAALHVVSAANILPHHFWLGEGPAVDGGIVEPAEAAPDPDAQAA